MTTRDGRRSRFRFLPGRFRAAALLMAAAGTQAGCGREFYREWANQDVSEAVFEKSRDPRWRIDLFSIEPPALSRHADPYDPDRPPAPPDDYPTEAMGPVPQWPDNRLIIAAEGTGYLDMLEYWKQNRQPDKKKSEYTGSATKPKPNTEMKLPTPPERGAVSPFSTPGGTGAAPNAIPAPTPAENPKTGENSGPVDPTLSPNSLPTANARTMPPQASKAKAKPTKDAGVFLTDYQITPNPATNTTPGSGAG